MGIATLQCKPGLECEEVQQDVVDAAGKCHTPVWCQDNATAPIDCTNLIHVALPGVWTCAEHQCKYETGMGAPICEDDASWVWMSTDFQQCMVIKYACDPGMKPFTSVCGCGCQRE